MIKNWSYQKTYIRPNGERFTPAPTLFETKAAAEQWAEYDARTWYLKIVDQTITNLKTGKETHYVFIFDL